MRQMGNIGDVSLYAASILRNKRSIVLDLKSPEGNAIARVAGEGRHPGKTTAPRHERLGMAGHVAT